MLKTPEDREKAIQQRLVQLETVASSYAQIEDLREQQRKFRCALSLQIDSLKAITGLINDFDKQVSI